MACFASCASPASMPRRAVSRSGWDATAPDGGGARCPSHAESEGDTSASVSPFEGVAGRGRATGHRRTTRRGRGKLCEVGAHGGFILPPREGDVASLDLRQVLEALACVFETGPEFLWRPSASQPVL